MPRKETEYRTIPRKIFRPESVRQRLSDVIALRMSLSYPRVLSRLEKTRGFHVLLDSRVTLARHVVEEGSEGLNPLLTIMRAFGGSTSLYRTYFRLDKQLTMHLLKEEREKIQEVCYNHMFAFSFFNISIYTAMTSTSVPYMQMGLVKVV